MKKFKTMVCALAAALFGFTAQAQNEVPSNVSFTVVIEDASQLSAQVNYQDYQIQNGANEITVPTQTKVMLAGVSPYVVKSVVDQSGTAAGYLNASQGSWEIYPSAADEGKVFTVVTANPEAARTASFTVNVDDASLVNLMRMSDYQTVTLTSGSNTVKFDPSNTRDCTFSINPAVYNSPLYQVKVNGTVKQAQYGSYEITVNAGDVVDITAKIPEIPATCTFTYSEGAEGCVESVSVNGEPAQVVNGKLEVMTGQKVLIKFNLTDYSIDLFKVNGKQEYAYSEYNYTVMGDTEFSFEAHKYAMVNATIKVNDASAVNVYRGYSYQNDIITLTGEETAISLSETGALISWAAKNGCYINGVKINGKAYTSDNYTIQEGDVIEIDAAKIVMDQEAVVWINNRALATTYFNFQGSDRSNIDIVSGYNSIEFYSGMTPFMLGWYSTEITSAQVYVNNEQQNPTYPGEASSLNFELPLQNGDVVKIFYNETPVQCTVDFNIAAGIETEVVADRISAVDTSAPYSCFNGTEIAINPGTGNAVKVNGTAVEPAENGICAVTVTDPATSIEITDGSQTSISEIAPAANGNEAVYDLAGRRVAKAGRGLYIINGKKVIR